jgi:hypothetical protein
MRPYYRLRVISSLNYSFPELHHYTLLVLDITYKVTLVQYIIPKCLRYSSLISDIDGFERKWKLQDQISYMYVLQSGPPAVPCYEHRADSVGTQI